MKNKEKMIPILKNNINNSLSERFMFQLTKEELERNWFQLETSSDNIKHSSTLPYAFTEQGVAMLATILRTKIYK